MNTSYWPSYEQIEKEILALSYDIFFDDIQLSTYSIHNADIILQIGSLNESILKDLYRNSTGKEPGEIKEVYPKIESIYKLESKNIHISNSRIYTKELSEFQPLNYEPKSKADTYSTYNAIKHNRAKNISKASIEAVLRALAECFILNIVLDNKALTLKTTSLNINIPQTFSYNSEIFTADVFDSREQIIEKARKIIINDPKISKSKYFTPQILDTLTSQLAQNIGYSPSIHKKDECLFIAELTEAYSSKIQGITDNMLELPNGRQFLMQEALYPLESKHDLDNLSQEQALILIQNIFDQILVRTSEEKIQIRANVN